MTRLALALLLILAPTARADMLPPDTRWADHRVRFENLGEFPDYAFFLYPRDLRRGQPGNSSVRVPDSGEATMGGNPLARGEAGGLFLYAIPKRLLGDGPPKDEWFENPTDGVLKSGPLVSQIRSVPVTETRAVFWTVYHVTMKDGQLALDLVSHDTPGRGGGTGGNPGGPDQTPQDKPTRAYIAVGLAATGVMMAVGWLVTRRRWKPAA